MEASLNPVNKFKPSGEIKHWNLLSSSEQLYRPSISAAHEEVITSEQQKKYQYYFWYKILKKKVHFSNVTELYAEY